MQSLGFQEEENRQQYVAQMPANQIATSEAATPEVEDARRRFILSLRALTSVKEREQRDAAARAQWMKTLDEDVKAHRQYQRKKHRKQWAIGAAVFGVLFAKNFHWLHWMGDYWWFFLFGIGGGAATQTGGKRPSEMARLLATSRDPVAVGVLAIAARDGDDETRRHALQGLRSMLPQLKASDAAHVNTEGMEALLWLLTKSHDSSLILAILRALEQIGDSRALPALDALERAAVSPQGREALNSARAYIMLRIGQEQYRQTLLRPTTSPIEPNQMLLRPAGSVQTSPNELLRPSTSD